MDFGSFDWILSLYVESLMAVCLDHGKESQVLIKTANFMTS